MQAIFDLMKSRLAQPDMAFFQHYRDDFFIHDCRELVEWGSPNASYLWFVRESGSDLTRLQTCPKHAERGEALLDLHDWSKGKLFHARPSSSGRSSATLSEVTLLQARELIEAPSAYERKGGVVTHAKAGMRSELTRLRIVWDRGYAAMPKAHVKCELSSANITLDHVTAIRLLALAEVVEETQSLFTGAQSINVNGESITDITARLRMVADARTQYASGRRAQEVAA